VQGISYDAGAMTRMIDRLEEKGLLQRSRCSTIAVSSTWRSRRRASGDAPDAARGHAVVNRFLEGFTKAEAPSAGRFLTRMLENAPRRT